MNRTPDTKRIYKEQEIRSATPAELVAHLYDFGIEACYREDQQRLLDVLSQLVKSLNFDYDISTEFYRLYDFCRQKARENQFEDARMVLENMREGWSEVVKVQRPNRKPTLNLNA